MNLNDNCTYMSYKYTQMAYITHFSIVCLLVCDDFWFHKCVFSVKFLNSEVIVAYS